MTHFEIKQAADKYIDEVYEDENVVRDYGGVEYDEGYLDAVDVQGRKAYIAGAEWMLGKISDFLATNYEDIGIRWMRGYDAEDLVETLRNALK